MNNVPNYIEQGGSRSVIGGELDIVAGGSLKIAGVDVTSSVATNGVTAMTSGSPVAGQAVAFGEVTLDGSNPTAVATGLASITAATVSFKTPNALADDPNALSCNYGDPVTAGTLNIYAWKNTSGTDPTQVASENDSVVVSWIAVGPVA